MKIVVAMSGGVDSSVAAYMLKKAGNEVVGVHFNFVGCKEKVSAEQALLDAKKVAKLLDIEFLDYDFTNEFTDTVITPFVNAYKNGVTPNPCANCNPNMKFKSLLKVTKELGADMMASGHYANVEKIKYDSGIEKFCIRKSKNPNKDQSYMLYGLTQEQLSHLIFPIGDMNKTEVREFAKELNLIVADKKDSQDVCFIDGDYAEFIKQYDFGLDYKEKIALGKLTLSEVESKPYLKKGEFVDLNGNVLGYHNGIINYTIGQRKGLNIAFGERKFVLKINKDKNQVVLGSNDDLMGRRFTLKNVVYSGIENENDLTKEYYAKLRYRHDGTLCSIKEKQGDKLVCELRDDVRAITPGQSAVFYDDKDRIMFGGIIEYEE